MAINSFRTDTPVIQLEGGKLLNTNALRVKWRLYFL